MDNIFEREHESILQTYKRLPVAVAKAEGCRIYTNDGECYLDFLAGIAVNALGHSNPKIIEACAKQMNRYMHLSNYFYQDVQIELAEELKQISGFDKVFFSNSGTESVEGALKLVRRWSKTRSKSMIYGFTGGFHGRTYGPLSLMDKPLYKAGMEPFLSDTGILEYNNCEMLEASINENTAAVILELIQGEGGISSVTDEFCLKLSELRDKYGFLIIADEIQSGAGRTGRFFGYEHFGAKPDIVVMAKGIGGGLPLGALLVSKELSSVFEKGMHGTTYGGNAVACAAGLAVVKELQSDVMQNASDTGAYLKECLTKLKDEFPALILEVRGFGLMLGLLLSFEAIKLVNALLEKKVISNAASGNVLRIVPPLIITRSDADEFLTKLRDCLICIN